MRIESYQFGKMVIDGIRHTNDVIIHKNKVRADWLRERSHHLTLADIPCLQEEKPDVLIIGTGKFGLVKIHKDVSDYCTENGIELIQKDSSSAVDIFNDMQDFGKHIIAVFHLTC